MPHYVSKVFKLNRAFLPLSSLHSSRRHSPIQQRVPQLRHREDLDSTEIECTVSAQTIPPYSNPAEQMQPTI